MIKGHSGHFSQVQFLELFQDQTRKEVKALVAQLPTMSESTCVAFVCFPEDSSGCER